MAIGPDDIPPAVGETVRLDEDPRFQQKQAERTTFHGAPPLNSRQEAIDWFDKIYTPAIEGDRYRIICERNYGEIIYLTRKDFIDTTENIKITILDEKGVPKQIPVSKLWLESTTRGEPRTVIFDPDPSNKFDKSKPEYNTWRGFATQSVMGNCVPFLDYVKNIICSGNEEHYHWLLCWTAQMFQEPHIKTGTSVIMRGGEGIGKSFYFETLGELISGRKTAAPRNDYYFKTSNPDHVIGKFNDHLAHSIFLLLEEAFWAGDQRGAHVFRDLVTGITAPSAKKFVSTKTVNSYTRVGMNGNEDWLVAAAIDSRRFLVLDVSDQYKNDESFWKNMYGWLYNSGLEALMHFFMNYKFDDVNLRYPPVTDALVDQRINTMRFEDAWWLDIVRVGVIPYVSIDDNGYVVVVAEVLFNLYCNSMRRQMVRNRSLQSDFGIKLHSFMPKLENGRVVKGGRGRPESLLGKKLVGGKGKQKVAYIIPPLNVCRELMDIRLGKAYIWEEPNEWQLLPDMSDGIMM